MQKEINKSPSTNCAVMVLTGVMLLITTHHASESDIWSAQWVHIIADVLAICMIACPFLALLKKK